MRTKKLNLFICLGTYILSYVLFSFPALAALPIGDRWAGNLIISPQTQLKVQFNFAENANGDYNVTLDSPDQGAFGLKGVVNLLTPDSVNIAFSDLSIRYAASVYNTPDGNFLYGTFRQAHLSLPLIMKQEAKSLKRPQEPIPPFPYQTREVTFRNEIDDVTLAGTLILPQDYYEDTPVVVLVSGSGLQNRDEEIFEHKPFAVIADHLARVGIATLRYDDRGFGESTGDASHATTLDFARDAAAAVDFVRDSLKIRKVGMLGHSEGATIAFMLAAGDDSPDFVIGLGTPAARGEDILYDQLCYAAGPDGAKDTLERTRRQENPWMQWFLEYNPVHDLMKLHVPALAIYGSNDRQVSPKLNVPILEAAAPSVEVKVYPGLNHLLQHSETGDPSEYYKITETISPEVLLDIVRFIREN